jgi:hypothetical protein
MKTSLAPVSPSMLRAATGGAPRLGFDADIR